jgi:hypothetical protein
MAYPQQYPDPDSRVSRYSDPENRGQRSHHDPSVVTQGAGFKGHVMTPIHNLMSTSWQGNQGDQTSNLRS